MTRQILIVDDSVTARTLFKACVAASGSYEVLEAGNWQDAVNLAVEKKPFLIVLDYNMPEKVGSEVAKLMQEKGVQSHFVLMSANTQDSVLEEVKQLGFEDIIEKPVSAEAVQTMLERLS